MSKHIVTFAPPTPNGGLHVGHLSGPYLAADVFARTQRHIGEEVLLISYCDDYQSYLHRKAFELDQDIGQLSQQNYRLIDAVLKQCDIQADAFVPALDNPKYLAAVDFFRRGIADHIRVKKQSIPYCPICQLWGYEAYGQGQCQECGAKSDHSQCESCAMPPDITGLSEVHCTICKKPMIERTIEREFFDLSGFKEYLSGLYQDKKLRNQFKQYMQRVLEFENLDWPIDRPNDFGIPCESAQFKLIHTWFAGIAGYYAASQEVADESIWRDPDRVLTHFIGFDCSFSHAVVYPSLLNAVGIKPQSINIYTNAFLKLNGEDFSTSRGIAIWADEMIREVDSDYLRFYLALVAPENQERNFDTTELVNVIEHQLHDNIVALLGFFQSSVLEKKKDEEPSELSNDAKQWLEKLRQDWLKNAASDNFSMYGMAHVLMESLQQMQKAATNEMTELLTIFTAWCVLAQPLMPKWTQQFLSELSLNNHQIEGWLCGKDSFPVIKGPAPNLDLSQKKIPSLQSVAGLNRSAT